MILAIVGTVLWRKTVAQMANEELDPSKDTDALQLLRELLAPAQDLRHAITELTPDKFMKTWTYFWKVTSFPLLKIDNKS